MPFEFLESARKKLKRRRSRKRSKQLQRERERRRRRQRIERNEPEGVREAVAATGHQARKLGEEVGRQLPDVDVEPPDVDDDDAVGNALGPLQPPDDAGQRGTLPPAFDDDSGDDDEFRFGYFDGDGDDDGPSLPRF